MILQLRLDERLIHGQITTAWSKALDVNAIVVANDRLPNDPLATKVLLMSAPAGKKVSVKPVDAAIKMLQDPRSEKMRIMIIVDNPTDVIRVAKGLDVKEINIANYVKKKSTEEKVMITKGCNADPEDLAIFKQMCEELSDAHIFSQLIPSQSQTDFPAIVRKL